MPIFLVVAMMAAVVLVGIGAVLAVVALVVCGVLMGVGIVSASSLIALANHRVSSGFQAFFLLLGTAAGLFSGVMLGVVAAVAFPPSMPPAETIFAGALGGLVTGVCAALLFNFAWVQLLRYFVKPKRFPVEAKGSGAGTPAEVIALPELHEAGK